VLRGAAATDVVGATPAELDEERARARCLFLLDTRFSTTALMPGRLPCVFSSFLTCYFSIFRLVCGFAPLDCPSFEGMLVLLFSYFCFGCSHLS